MCEQVLMTALVLSDQIFNMSSAFGAAGSRQHGAVRTSSIPAGFQVGLAIGLDAEIDDLTTQQALPAGEAKCGASGILQLDGHHQTLTTSAFH